MSAVTGWRAFVNALPCESISEAIYFMNLSRTLDLTSKDEFLEAVTYVLQAADKNGWRFQRPRKDIK